MANNDLFQIKSGAKEINIKMLLQKYLRYWYLFLIAVILCGGLAYLHLNYNLISQYKVDSTLFIKDSDNSGNVNSFSEMGIFSAYRNLENEIEVIKSNRMMYRAMEELSLRVNYQVKGRWRNVEVHEMDLPIKVMPNEATPYLHGVPVKLIITGNNSFVLEQEDKQGGKSGTSHRFGQEIQKPYGTFTVVANSAISSADSYKEVIFHFQDIQAITDQYRGKLTVVPVNKSASILSISLVDAVPQKGIDIINKLIEVYNEEFIEDKNQLAINTIELIDERMKHLTKELTDVEKNVERYKQRNDLTDVSSEAQMYLQRASEYNRQLAEFEIQIDILSSIEGYLKNQENDLELVPSSLNILDPTLNGLIAKFNELQLERHRMLRTTTKDNPIVTDLVEQLYNLRINILENLRNIKDGLTITQKSLQASSAKFESRIQKVPSIERELLEISRQQSIKEGLYLYLLQKREEAALSLVAAVSNSRIIDPARAFPQGPNINIIYTLAIMIGLGLPFAGIFVKEALNDKVQVQADVELATDTPILGEIAHHSQNGAMVINEKSNTPVAELFRLVRSNLQFATLGKPNKVILVTSAMSGEGKTFFTINLGASLALSGKKVVLIGLDFRKPMLMKDLGLSNKTGITTYLINDDLPVQKIVVPTGSIQGLYVAGSGPIPYNPGELMMSEKIGALIEQLKEDFDYIIMDTAPIGQVADAFALSRWVDSSIYLVRYDFTAKAQLEVINDIYRNKKLKNPMIVLNDAKTRNGYGYGYGYGYGNGNGTQHKRKKVDFNIVLKRKG
jgi:tyrosine-protein kinase Etk/Wzc